MKAVIFILCLLLGSAASADEVRYWVVYRPRGTVWVVAENDAQAQRKLRQGNVWGVGLNTRGLTHATGAIRWQGRTFLVDLEGQKRWVAIGAEVIVIATQ